MLAGDVGPTMVKKSLVTCEPGVAKAAGASAATGCRRRLVATSKVLPAPDIGKLECHSFRKTVIHGLQAAVVQAEPRAAYFSYEIDDEYHASYGMNATK